MVNEPNEKTNPANLQNKDENVEAKDVVQAVVDEEPEDEPTNE